MANPNSELDAAQCTQAAYDGANQAHRVEDLSLLSSFSSGSNSIRVNVVDGAPSGMTVIESDAIPYTSINGSGGAIFQIKASTTGNISLLVPNEQTGIAYNLYTGASGFEVPLMILAPGQDNEVNVSIPTGTRLSIRALNASAPTAGTVYLTWVG